MSKLDDGKYHPSTKEKERFLKMWPNDPDMWPKDLMDEQIAAGNPVTLGKKPPLGGWKLAQEAAKASKAGRPRTRKGEWIDLNWDAVRKMSHTLAKASKDLRFFIETFLLVVDKAGNSVPFTLWFEQEQIVREAQRQYDETGKIRLWILKPRQIGSSTLCAAIVFWVALFHGTANCRVVAHDRKASTSIFRHVRRFRDLFPKEALLLPGEKATTAVSFDNRLLDGLMHGEFPEIDPNEPPKADYSMASRIGIEVLSATTGRGEPIQALWCSEFAFWVRGGVDLAPDAFLAVRQSVPEGPGTCIIVESTANGMGGMFYAGFWRAWNKNQEGAEPSEFSACFYPWFDHHEYTMPAPNGGFGEEGRPKNEYERWLIDTFGAERITSGRLVWRRWAIREKCNNDLLKFRQEYPATPEEAFIARGLPVFDPETLALMEKECKKHPPILQGDFFGGLEPKNAENGALRLWKHPEAGRTYCIGADPAMGVRGGDFSVAYVRDVGNGDYMATYRGRMDMDAFAGALNSLGRYYNEATMGVEANPGGGGLYVNRRLMNVLQYPKMVMTERITGIGDLLQDRVGIWTHIENREHMILSLSSALKNGIIRLFDPLFIEEAKNFQRDEITGKPGPLTGHDDCVMAAALTEASAAQTPLLVHEPTKEVKPPWITKYLKQHQEQWEKQEKETEHGIDLFERTGERDGADGWDDYYF